MLNKQPLRNKYLKLRKKKYFEVNIKYFKPFLIFLNKHYKNKLTYLSIYHPSNHEVNTLKLFELIKNKKNIITLLPTVRLHNNMKFYKWSFLDILKINKYGILEPTTGNKALIPNIALVPLLAFDKKNNRLGYGKGYYDKFLNKYLKLNKNILTIGVAFSFQKYNKLPTSNLDVKLNYILTEKGMQKV